MKLFKRLKYKKYKPEAVIKYIHPTRIDGFNQNIDKIVEQLNAASLIARKMKTNNCEVSRFNMYKNMFHELWVGVAEQYNNINTIDINKNSDEIYIE